MKLSLLAVPFTSLSSLSLCDLLGGSINHRKQPSCEIMFISGLGDSSARELKAEVSVFWVMEIRSGRTDKQRQNKHHNFSFKEKKPALPRRESISRGGNFTCDDVSATQAPSLP